MKGRLFAALAFCGCGECFGIKAAKGDLVCSDLIYNYLVSMPIKSCSHSRSLACSGNVLKATAWHTHPVESARFLRYAVFARAVWLMMRGEIDKSFSICCI